MSRTTTQTPEKESFNDSFARLAEIANKLQSQQNDPDIDQLVQMVEEAVKHYQVCKKRIDQVEKTVKEKLAPLIASAKRGGSEGFGSAPSSDDDDNPF